MPVATFETLSTLGAPDDVEVVPPLAHTNTRR